MIVRRSEDHLLLITQPDHARLAAAIMAEWEADSLPDSPRRDIVLFATAHHDDGWLDVDEHPLVDADGRVLDFMTAPEEVRLAIWPRAVESLADRPYAAALVAQHALQIYEPYRGRVRAQTFFSRMEDLRTRYLERAAPYTLHELLVEYFFVGMGDTLSLAFCDAWQEPQRLGPYQIRAGRAGLTIEPDPFGGRDIRFAVNARRLPNRAFTAAEAAAAFDAAPVIPLTAVASGRLNPSAS